MVVEVQESIRKKISPKRRLDSQRNKDYKNLDKQSKMKA